MIAILPLRVVLAELTGNGSRSLGMVSHTGGVVTPESGGCHVATGLGVGTVGGQESSRPRLRTSFLWTLAGNVVYAGCQWAMLIVLAKLGSTDMVGEFSLGFALCAPIFMLSNLNLRGVQATDARFEYDFGDYFCLRLLATALAMVCVALLAFGTSYGPAMSAVILLVGAAKSFESLSDVYYGRLQQHEQMKRIAYSLIVRGLVSTLGLAAAIFMTQRLIVGLAVLAGAWGLTWALVDSRLSYSMARAALAWRPRNLARLAWLSLPLGIVLALISLNANLPRYFVERSLGIEELGVFSALGYFVVAGGMVSGALGQVVAPRLAHQFALGDVREFRRLLLKLIGLSVLLGLSAVVLTVIAGPFVLSLVYRPEYARHNEVLIWLMIGSGPAYAASFLGHALTAARAFRVQPPLFLATTIVTGLASWVLVPRGGLVGAAQAALIATCFQALVNGVVVGMLCVRKDARR